MNSLPTHHVLTFEERGNHISYLNKQIYLPEFLPSDASCRSQRTSTYSTDQYDHLSFSAYDYSKKLKLDNDGLNLSLEDSRPHSPDPLHIPERPFPRYGVCRYITEDEHSFTLTSLRGWSNFAALFVIAAAIIVAFVAWPVWSYLEHHKNAGASSGSQVSQVPAVLQAESHRGK